MNKGHFVPFLTLATLLLSSQVSVAQLTLVTPDLSDLEAAQKNLDAQNATFKIGTSEASKLDLQALTGAVVPEDLITQAMEQAALSQRLQAASIAAIQDDPKLAKKEFKDLRSKCAANADSFDWRDQGVVSPVQHQGQCGSCWAFAAVGALEANFHIVNSKDAPLSEQFVLNCAANHGCKGNWFGNAFTVLMAGAPSRSTVPYRAAEAMCMPNTAIARAINWSYLGSFGATPSDHSLKQALCDHGPIVVAIKATPLFKYYKEGVFNEYAQGNDAADVNHAVLLTGWNDAAKAWTIKNSWGSDWGESGLMRISYRSNNIGFGAAWVEATRIETAPAVDPAVAAVLRESAAAAPGAPSDSALVAEANRRRPLLSASIRNTIQMLNIKPQY
jgi:cathepsin L